MSTNKKALEEVQSKIEWEGGLFDYVHCYGGELAPEMQSQVEAFRVAADALEGAWNALLEANGVELQ